MKITVDDKDIYQDTPASDKKYQSLNDFSWNSEDMMFKISYNDEKGKRILKMYNLGQFHKILLEQ